MGFVSPEGGTGWRNLDEDTTKWSKFKITCPNFCEMATIVAGSPHQLLFQAGD
jgi:hypothetical protein